MENSDLKRVGLVTERYWELQGLRSVLVGAAYLCGALVATGLAPGGWPFSDPAVTAFLVMFAIVIPGMLYLDRYYASAFGRVMPTREGRRFGTLVMPGLSVLAVTASPIIGAPAGGLFFLAWATFGLWITIRDWPFRGHHLLDVLAGVLAAVVAWQTGDAASAMLPMVNGLAVIGVAAIVTGYLDHSLLTAAAGRSHPQAG